MLRTLVMMAGALCAAGATGAELDGTYVLKTRSGSLVTRMQVDGGTLRGVIEVPDGTPIRLRGTAQQDRARGIATSAYGDGQFQAQVVGDRLRLVITQEAGPNQRALDLPLEFLRTQ